MANLDQTGVGYLWNKIGAAVEAALTELNAMSKSGGTFTGSVTLNGDPTEALHAATKQYVDNGMADLGGCTVLYGTIGTNWIEDEETGAKYQMVTIEGAPDDIADHDAIMDVVMTHTRDSDGYATFVEETNHYLDYITNGDGETVAGGVMIYVYGDVNTVDIPIKLVVV